MRIKRLGLIFKRESPEAEKFAIELIKFLIEKNFTILLPSDLARVLGREDLGVRSIETGNIDALVVIGGDGTLLKTFHAVKGGIPIIPVNSDTLGFFYDINRHNYRKAFTLITEGKYEIKTWRTGLLEVEGENSKLSFLNEAVIYSRKRAKMMIFELKKGKEIFAKGRCDGVIIATTLGSTAYSLSQGGPIVDWELEALVFTPISPFSPIVKPIVFNSNTWLNLKLFTDSTLVIDGYLSADIEKGKCIKISLRGKPFNLVKVYGIGTDFFEKIRRRLADEIFYSKFF